MKGGQTKNPVRRAVEGHETDTSCGHGSASLGALNVDAFSSGCLRLAQASFIPGADVCFKPSWLNHMLAEFGARGERFVWSLDDQDLAGRGLMGCSILTVHSSRPPLAMQNTETWVPVFSSDTVYKRRRTTGGMRSLPIMSGNLHIWPSRFRVPDSVVSLLRGPSRQENLHGPRPEVWPFGLSGPRGEQGGRAVSANCCWCQAMRCVSTRHI